MRTKDYTKKELLEAMGGYFRMIERDNFTYPTAVLGDIKASIKSILRACNYKIYHKGNENKF